MLLRWVTMMALVVFLVPATARADRRVALVVGNSAYQHATALRNPVNDANDVADSLKKLGFEVVVGLDLDQQGFAASIEKFARELDNADVGLFFYAGHGLQMNDKNYLVSLNAKLESEFLLSSEAIQLDSIVRLMESKVPTNLVFLDACRNNPMADVLRRNLIALNRSAQLGRGLARVESSGRDTLIAFSAAPGQEAGDGSERNSPFTTALLKHLQTPGLEVSVMLKEVAADVRRETRNAQRPQQLSDMTKAFYFAKLEPPAAVKTDVPTPAPPAPASVSEGNDRSLDMAFWTAAQSANQCEAVRAYLQRFPDGVFVDLARISERRLCTPGRAVTIIDAPPSSAPAPLAISQPEPALPAAPPQTPDQKPTAAPALKVAAVPDAASLNVPEAKPTLSRREIARTIQIELFRTGCMDKQPDGAWSDATREALQKFNKHARTKLDADQPTIASVAALQAQSGRVCPLECGRGQRTSAGRCIATPEPAGKRRKVVRTDRDKPVYRGQGEPVTASPSPPPPAPAVSMGGGFGGLPIGVFMGFGRRH